MGDLGDERCGVGSSLAALVRAHPDIGVLDTAGPGWRSFARRARELSRRPGPCVVEYPTRSTAYEWRLVPRVVLLRLVFGDRLRVHIHELRHLRRMLRWPASLAFVLADRIVVSSASEAAAVRSALGGFAARRAEVLVAPPVNGSAPTSDELAGLDHRCASASGTVGVFGLFRPDKALGWLIDVLVGVDARFERLVLAGGGWDEVRWPRSITDRYQIETKGHVPRSDLPGLFKEWGLAIAPFDQPAHDGRMSLRTPLAFGVPTLSVGPVTVDLTTQAPHLHLVPPERPDDIGVSEEGDRRAAAAVVAAFEERTAAHLLDALFGPPGRDR